MWNCIAKTFRPRWVGTSATIFLLTKITSSKINEKMFPAKKYTVEPPFYSSQVAILCLKGDQLSLYCPHVQQCPCDYVQAWDDVERKVKPAEKPYDYSRSRPLEQEKSKLSLAEVYEQEYLKQTQVSVIILCTCSSRLCCCIGISI